MATAELADLAKNGDVESFEAACLEALGNGSLRLKEIAGPFRRLWQASKNPKLAELGLTILQNSASGDGGDAHAALILAKLAATADPQRDELRKLCADYYRKIYADRDGVEDLIETSGLLSGRPPRNATRVLDLCLELKPGDALMSRTEDVVVEVLEIDLLAGLVTLRRRGRATNVPVAELAREYERVDPNDFRVLKQVAPDRLNELIDNDPVSLVVGILKSYGEDMDLEELRLQLVPTYIEQKAWSRWWSKARTALKRCQNVTLEGRAPLILSYTEEARTLEDETWDAMNTQTEPTKWLGVVESYLREKKQRKEEPDASFLQRCHQHVLDHVNKIRTLRPTEALAGALVLERIDEMSGVPAEEAEQLAVATLREAEEPVELLRGLADASLWDLAMSALVQSRAEEAPEICVNLLLHAPNGVLDRLVEIALEGGKQDAVQVAIDAALDTPHENAEVFYWLWKGPKQAETLRLPNDADLFELLLDTLRMLGRTINAPKEVMRHFRERARSALALKSYAKARECIEKIDPHRAITIRREIEWLDGIGDTTQSRLLTMLREVHPQLWAVKPTKALAAWEDPNVLWTTALGLENKNNELDHLVNVEMHENARRIGEAAAMGDLSENSEYKFALEERDLLRGRLAKINADLALAREITPSDVPTDHVGVGSRVTLKETEGGRERTMTFLGPFDSNADKGYFNYKAPFSQKLMGCRVGEATTITLDGLDIAVEVVRIENALASGEFSAGQGRRTGASASS